MRILQLANKLPYPSLDGGAIAIRMMAEGLASCGNEVLIMAMNTQKHYLNPSSIPSPESPDIQLITVDVPAEISSWEGLKNLFFSDQPYSLERFTSSLFENRLIEVLKNRKIDLVILEGLYTTPYIQAIRTNSQAKIAYRAHNIESEIWNRLASHSTNFLKGFYYRNLAKRIGQSEQALMNSYDFLLPVTERDAQAFQTMGNLKPVQVVPVGMNSTESEDSLNESNKLDFFHLGAMDWAPNQEGLRWFVDAVWTIHHANYKETVFHVAGRNAPSGFAQLLKKIPGVKYHGEVPSAPDFMANHEVMIVPLLSGSGMRVKIVEGMLAGKCVLATSVALEGIPVVHAEHVFVANTAEEFLFWMRELTENPQIRIKIARQAKKLAVDLFDKNVIAAKLNAFLVDSMGINRTQS